jgi:hyperosmotically inducible protein
MNRRIWVFTVCLLSLAAVGFAQDRDQPSAKSQGRIIREVRHELLMLPYVGVFDNMAYKVEGGTVTLLGEVVRPVTKSDAESAVKHIEGVEKVDNQIEILPPSPMDDGSEYACTVRSTDTRRWRKYALGVQKPIRIIVKNGRVTLEGVVDNEADKNVGGPSRQRRARNLLGDKQFAGGPAEIAEAARSTGIDGQAAATEGSSAVTLFMPYRTGPPATGFEA